ncbi:MAG: histidine--tRNA ligase [Bacteroidales bacterium]|jgi:histidyl-tRNA synthetase|nr:histidine--tRNA ligase [Bacteroidales bacterium]MDD4213643.1 histidine--tRNA ligase [Bacteroidales bacterium]
MAVNVSIPKGTRDFSPLEMSRRKYIFKIIEDVFLLYGYKPIETPAMESLGTLTGKYGEEGDRLIFKILNSGNFMEGINAGDIEKTSPAKLASRMCEKALKYDLTVPFARFVVMNRNEITFPFKRYQIQPVWRADRPQKGRYREFYQCDVDVIGSKSLLNEVELFQIIDDIFQRFGINITIKLNNRKLLNGIAEIIGQADKITAITVAIDKIDKTGIENVIKELSEKGLSEDAIEKIKPLLSLGGDNDTKFEKIREFVGGTASGQSGLKEINEIFESLKKLPIKAKIEFDVTLARGLDYYTGAIIEVKASDVAIGSICGGGRYDDLTGIFGLPDISGVGVSFGADRIYDVLNELKLFPAITEIYTKVLFINFGDEETRQLFPVAQQVRNLGISCEVYPENAKLKKQFSYADNNKIPFVIIAGPDEIAKGKYKLRYMTSGIEKELTFDELLEELKK